MLIHLNPRPKPRMVQSDKWRKRPVVQKYWEYKDALRKEYPHELPESLYLSFAIQMPKSWTKRKKEQLRHKPHQQKPDVDNLVKAVMDCLSDEDSGVYKVHAQKYWADEGSVQILPLDHTFVLDLLPEATKTYTKIRED